MQSSVSDRPVVTTHEAAEMLAVSERHIYVLNRKGMIPRPRELGRCLRWPRSEFLAWIDAGMPNRDEWEALRKSAGKIPAGGA